MSRRAIRIATTKQLERSVREAGFETYVLSEHLYSHRITKLVELLRQAGVLPKKCVTETAPTSAPQIHVQGVTDAPASIDMPVSAP